MGKDRLLYPAAAQKGEAVSRLVLIWFLCGCAMLVYDQLAGEGDSMTISFIGYQILWPKLLWEKFKYRRPRK